ncbi:MAG: hypothetical protein HZB91_03210 [Elusimicrobia bacterium]|nr:hypothetical protein [Elusimicrobiota bacterium]
MIHILLAAALVPAFASADAPASKPLEDAVCCGNNRYEEALRLFRRIKRPSEQDLYLAAFTWMQLHEPGRAVPLLKRASQSGFAGLEGWPTSADLLDRAARFEKAKPPLRAAQPARRITIHAPKGGEWSKNIIDAVTAWEKVGRDIFGAALPPIELYLFEERPSFDEFYTAAFALPAPTDWQDATGNIGIVVDS